MSQANLGQYFHQQWYWQHQTSTSSTWTWFPNWAKFFMDLGAAVATERTNSSNHFTIVVTVPTGGMAAPLVAAGVILESWWLSHASTPEQHLAQLKALPLGTTVTYQSPGSSQVVFAQFDGFRDDLFQLTVAEKKGKHASAKRLPTSLAQYIKVAPRQLDKVPIRKRRRPLAVRDGLTSLLSQSGGSTSVIPHLGCTLISKKSKAAHELGDVGISMLSDNDLGEGTLQDLVKLDLLADKKTFEPYTTRFISVDAKPKPVLHKTPIVVFDGCRGYLARQQFWEDSTRIVVADRCESTFSDLVTTINGELFYGKPRMDLELLGEIPEGIELMGFSQ